jgi:hypothetical protein
LLILINIFAIKTFIFNYQQFAIQNLKFNLVKYTEN